MATIREMTAERAQHVKAAKTILDAAKADGDRDLSAEEAEQVDDYMAKVEALDGQIEAKQQAQARRDRVNDLASGLAEPAPTRRQSASIPEGITDTRDVGSVRARVEDDPRGGFKSAGHYLMSVVKAGMSEAGAIRAGVDERLQPLAAAGSDEHSTLSDSRGGFLIPEGFLNTLLQVTPEADPTAGLVTNIPMGTDVVKIPARVDKNHTSSVSGGFSVAYGAETAQIASSRTKFEQIKLEAHRKAGLAYVSEELLTRSPQSFVAIVQAGFGQEIASVNFQKYLRGTGVGEPMGVFNSGAFIEVAKETSQTADTINGTNIAKMRARCWNYSNAIWIANHDTYVQLATAHIAGTNGDVFLFAPGNGTDVPPTLLGRPIFFSEYAATLGDANDISLHVPSEYLRGMLGGMETSESPHIRFDYHERAFKIVMYDDGQPWWSAALTPNKSSSTLSPFVGLAARA